MKHYFINNYITEDIRRRKKEELEETKSTGISNLKTVQQFKNANVKEVSLNLPVGTVFETRLEGRDRGDDYIAWIS